MAEAVETPPPRYDDIFPVDPEVRGQILAPGQPPTCVKLEQDVQIPGCITAVTMDTDHVYVQTDRKPTVIRYDLSARATTAYGSGSGGMMLTLDPEDEGEGEGCMCVAEGGTVARTRPDGTPLTTPYHRHLPIDGDHDIVSMATLHKDNKVKYAVVDVHLGCVLIVEPFEGKVKRTIQVAKGDQFEPRYIATDVNLKHTLVVSGLHSNQVRLYSRKGEMVGILGCYGNGDDRLCEPAGVCVDTDSRVLVCDHGNGRVVRFTKVAKGTWQGHCVLTPDMLHHKRPCHASTSPSGHVVVSVQSKYGEWSWMLYSGYQ